MSKQKKMVEHITAMDEDFAKWYTDVVKQADLIDYGGMRGMFVIRPYGYAIWENIQQILDKQFKACGHENVYMPMFIPESLLQKEKDHVEGFAPEVAWVTHGGSEKLTERLCVRPTSETLFCEHYANIIHSYRDLPKLYNQWCNVVRWEKSTRPFLRHREFLWQEGHTMHATKEEAMTETLNILEIYADLCENYLAMPVIRGRKTEKEKFAGAEATFAIECMMHDGKALQAGTSHYFGDGFARAFDIQYADKDNQMKYPFETSWGVSTRLIGGIIMTHGDDNGLVLPPAIAPIQAVIIPINAKKEGVLDAARRLFDRLLEKGIRVKLDDADQSPGWKFAEYEMRGVPVRIELGPKDLEQQQCVLVRRDNREKAVVPLDGIAAAVQEQLQLVHQGLYQKALDNRASKMYTADNFETLVELANTKSGFIGSMWCGSADCETKAKEEAGVTSRCMPSNATHEGHCAVCGGEGKHFIYWGKAY